MNTFLNAYYEGSMPRAEENLSLNEKISEESGFYHARIETEARTVYKDLVSGTNKDCYNCLVGMHAIYYQQQAQNAVTK